MDILTILPIGTILVQALRPGGLPFAVLGPVLAPATRLRKDPAEVRLVALGLAANAKLVSRP